jgi:4-hydroxybenzoate polyprenyltransferase
MKLLAAFLKLIRFPNLLFIAITQVLFYLGVILPIWHAHPGAVLQTGWIEFLLLLSASVLIAAGGYIINDYFDLNIDRVNRPGKLVIERVIKRRWAIVWHIVFSAIGVALSVYLGYRLGNPMVGLLNLLSVVLLWFYSTSFKKQLLVGNVIISLLTAWVVLVQYVCETHLRLLDMPLPQVAYQSAVFKAAVLYGGFAFVISLIREVVKDMEDMEGDARYHCRTMPIVWGIPASRSFVYTWMLVLAASILIVTVYTFQIHWWWMSAYLLVAVMLPLAQVFRIFGKTSGPQGFAAVSRLIKGIMLTGILSMLFFKIYL